MVQQLETTVVYGGGCEYSRIVVPALKQESPGGMFTVAVDSDAMTYPWTIVGTWYVPLIF